MNVALKGRTNCVFHFAATFRILSRLNLKAPPFEGERLFTRNVQWTYFRVLDLFQINALFLRTYKIVIFMATRKEQLVMKPNGRVNPVAFAMIRN
jgi:hypothetical protein